MYLFIISVILVTIVSLCVFKNRFWENRYLILLIIAATSLVSMTTVNFSIRGSLPKYVEIGISKQLIPLHVAIPDDSTYVDTIIPFLPQTGRIPRTYNLVQIDTILQITSHIIFYEYDNTTYVGWNDNNKKRVSRRKPLDIYFGVSENPRFELRILKHDARKTPWVTSYSLPEIDGISVLWIPQHEYDALKEEYKREMPF